MFTNGLWKIWLNLPRFVQIKNCHLLCLFLIFCIISVLGCGQKIQPVRQTQLKMGTYVSISIYTRNGAAGDLSGAFRAAFQAIDEVEATASRHLNSSRLTELNQHGATEEMPVDPLLFGVIRNSLNVAAQTDGAFDPTIAPMLDLWGFGKEKPHKPPQNEISALLPRINFRDVLIDSPAVRFAQPGMAIDLGGIAKGTAIDAAARALRKTGVKDFMVDAGGDLAIHSSELTRGKIRIWIRHPRKMDALFGYFFLDSGYVATSGDYEQFFEENGKRYCHILNPKTGYPDSDVLSVTVLAKTAELSDAYATAIFVMGGEKGIAFARQHPELQVVILFRGDGKINYWASDTLLKKIGIVDDSLK